MRNVIIFSVLFLVLGFGVGFYYSNYYKKDLKEKNAILKEQEDLKPQGSGIAEEFDVEEALSFIYCNPETVKEQILKHYEFYVPDKIIQKDSWEVMEIGDCRYHVRFITKDRRFQDYLQKVIVVEFSYFNNFEQFEVRTIRESNF